MSYLILLILGLIIGNRIPFWLGNLISRYRKWRILNDMTPTEIDYFRLCPTRHVWFNADSMNEEGEIVKTLVCEHCGFIPAKNMMTTENNLKNMKETREALAFEDDVEKSFIKQEEDGIGDYFKEEIKSGLEVKKLFQVYNAGQSAKQRFILYKMLKTKELRESKAEVKSE